MGSRVCSTCGMRGGVSTMVRRSGMLDRSVVTVITIGEAPVYGKDANAHVREIAEETGRQIESPG